MGTEEDIRRLAARSGMSIADTKATDAQYHNGRKLVIARWSTAVGMLELGGETDRVSVLFLTVLDPATGKPVQCNPLVITASQGAELGRALVADEEETRHYDGLNYTAARELWDRETP